ncbi:MFS general substrate transporter [Tothia fuscella]|uniref:MFS general substrate transporter n=1 Tax=Tothia fuscella TaxID=1048955 RepID=A0A9P4NRD0_9PEZI|nr:MFS general substrate transporter [Tothia fuscella]
MAPKHSGAADEITPLLASNSSTPIDPENDTSVLENGNRKVPNGNGHAPESEEDEEDDDTPLPMGQIFILCIARMIDPIAFFSIFPFVPSMVQHMDVPEVDVGFYTGLIESIFSIVQMCTMIYWGRLADKYGRKPVLVISLVGVALAVTLFGTSQNIWQMVLFRSLGGLFSGSVVCVRAMFSENSTKKTQARAFSFFGFAGNIGIFLGPLIGGLAKPVEQYPSLFAGNKLFTEFPYLLPTMISGGIAAVGAIVVAVFVKETLKVESVGSTTKKPTPMTTMEILKSPGVPITLAIFGYSGLLGFAYTAMCPVFWFTSIPRGGFSFSPKYMSLFLSIAGVSQALWLLLVFPWLQRRIGTGGVLRWCTRAWPVMFALNPVYNVFLRLGWNGAFWGLAPLNQAVGSGVAMAFTGVQLALNDISPSHQCLGTLNGMALTLNSAVRAITPAAASSIYAYGVREKILWGQLGWAVLTALAVGYAILILWLPEKAEGRPEKKNTSLHEE